MFGMEILDKAADISRDYLIAPTATTSAPAIDVLPKPWPEFIMALLFIVVMFAAKGFHKHYQEHRRTTPGGKMQAGDLRTGDTFYYVDPEDWLAMSQRDKNRQRRHTVLALGPECKTDRTRVHLATDHGMHCVPFVMRTTRVESKAKPAHRPTPKSRALVGA